ncbi:MAG: ammonia channel protein, partial [Alphaproteobacteria bacterium]
MNAADTSWLLTSTALVLLMTLPGLALFYAGLVQSKNILSVLMQCMAIACLASVIWFVVGYSIAFAEGTSIFGGFSKALLLGISRDTVKDATTIPETLFVMFQMTFAIITPALMIGA